MARLVLIGNGFDLAHGMKTTYNQFLDWYYLQAFETFRNKEFYQDVLMTFQYSRVEPREKYPNPSNMEDVFALMSRDDKQKIQYSSTFFKRLVELFKTRNWVNIEYRYFEVLRSMFKAGSKNEEVIKLNEHFDFIIKKLSEYFEIVNSQITSFQKIKIAGSKLKDAFIADPANSVIFLNFNYTDTLLTHNYAYEHEVIFIHGRVSDIKSNPLIFGYGDESDPCYQEIEDSGNNAYLDHIKSFGYFKTDNYSKLMSFIDAEPYEIFIVGHSCGLSDRILLREIFEHKNCQKIHIYYHRRKDSSDNYKEITQEISRHFRPQNKEIMRRKVKSQDPYKIIPQNY